MFFDIRSQVSITFKKAVCLKNVSKNRGLGLKSRNYLNFYTLSVNS